MKVFQAPDDLIGEFDWPQCKSIHLVWWNKAFGYVKGSVYDENGQGLIYDLMAPTKEALISRVEYLLEEG